MDQWRTSLLKYCDILGVSIFFFWGRGGGAGVLKEFLGGDVPLGPWNP